MCDGCDEVTIERSSRDGKTLTVTSSPSTQIVTVSEGHGNHYKRVLVRGVVRRQQGQHPYVPSESAMLF